MGYLNTYSYALGDLLLIKKGPLGKIQKIQYKASSDISEGDATLVNVRHVGDRSEKIDLGAGVSVDVDVTAKAVEGKVNTLAKNGAHIFLKAANQYSIKTPDKEANNYTKNKDINLKGWQYIGIVQRITKADSIYIGLVDSVGATAMVNVIKVANVNVDVNFSCQSVYQNVVRDNKLPNVGALVDIAIYKLTADGPIPKGEGGQVTFTAKKEQLATDEITEFEGKGKENKVQLHNK